MNDSLNKVTNKFEEQAGQLLVQLFNQFESATAHLDRQTDENVFLQFAGKYSYTYKQELTNIALMLIEEHQHKLPGIDLLQQVLTRKLHAYVNEFSQKTKEM